MLRMLGELPAHMLEADGQVWLWSDLHLGHENIIRYTNRPFASVEAMDAAIYANWRKVVSEEGTLIFVGDVAMRHAVSEVTWQRVREGAGKRKLLVAGNHDLTGSGSLRVTGFDQVNSLLCLKGDPPIVCTHLPLASLPEGWVNVHGHTHDEPPQRSAHINVSLEQLDYQPISLERVRMLARELAAGRYPPGKTTLEQITKLESE
ncbi:MAG: metallophosphoesterase [Halieaceae bacterium]|nr:metallophosphoesterase [Halieaceae bacterium]